MSRGGHVATWGRECKERRGARAGGVTRCTAIMLAANAGGRRGRRGPQRREQRMLKRCARTPRTPTSGSIRLSINTVKYHVANMLAKLDLHSRDELTGWKLASGRGMWGIAATHVAFAVGASMAGAAVLAGGILFAVHGGTSDSGADGPPIVYVSPFSNTGSNLFSVQPGGAPKQLTHQGSSYAYSRQCGRLTGRALHTSTCRRPTCR